MKNIGQYNQDLSVPRKKDIDSLETRVKTNEDNIAMAESDIEGLNTDVGTLKTDVSNVKTALNSKQNIITGAASTIVEDNLTAGKVLVSDASGKVGAASVGIDDINPDRKYLKLSGGYVTGPVGLWGGVTGPLTIKNGAVTLNEGYSIGYGDENYKFTQIAGNFSISKGNSSQGVYIASSTDGTNGSLRMDVSNDSQNASTSMNMASNGVIRLEATERANGSLMVNNVRVTGIADGTANNDAVNLSQLKQYLPLVGGTMTGALDMGSQKIINVADGTDDSDVATVKQAKAGTPKGPVMVIVRDVTLGAAHEVIHNNLWDCTFLGTIYGTRYIDGVAVQVYPQSYIISVGGSDYDYEGGYCAVQKSANSMSVVIKMLCFSSTAPDSIQIPCLVW